MPGMMFGRPGNKSHIAETVKGVAKAISETAFKDRRVYVANQYSKPIYVFVTPTLGLAFANTFISTARLNSSVQSGSVTPQPMTALRNVNDFEKLTKVIQLTGLAGRAAASQDNQVQYQADLNSIREVMKANAIVIQAGAAELALKIDTVNPLNYLKGDTWAALINSDSFYLFIATEDMQHFVFVKTGADDSWIFRGKDVVRAQYGTLNQPQPADGRIFVPRGDRLPSGSYLEPGESLVSPNRKYALVYQEDGNAVVYDVEDVTKHKPTWASNTGGKDAGRLTLSDAGKVSLVGKDGAQVWTDPRSLTDKATKFESCILAIGDDGVVRVVSEQKKVGWSSQWKSGEDKNETWG